uniref:DUF3265 domain-containing protein n=1 Tax=Heterorhabditis bacteriophora TaxID=37862 RepID=A0A1I7WFB6_HETBA
MGYVFMTLCVFSFMRYGNKFF